jgi:histone H3/H4
MDDRDNICDESMTEAFSEPLTAQNEVHVDHPAAAKSTLPISRVKAIMRQDEDVQAVSGDAVFAMSVAAEAFLEILIKESYQYTFKESRKTVNYKDVGESLSFL